MTRPSPLVGRALRLGNRVLDPVLSRPAVARLFRSEPVRVRYTGRRSGRMIELPAWGRRTAAGVVIGVGMPAQKTWWRNFRTAQPLEVRIGDAWRPGTGVVHEARPGDVAVHVTWAP